MRLNAALARSWESPAPPPLSLVDSSQSPAADSTLSPKQLLELAQAVHSETDGQVKFADTKASIVVIIVGILATRLADTFKQGALQSMWSGGLSGRLACVCVALTMGCLVGCIAKAVLAIKPSIRYDKVGSLFFFGRISRMSKDQFIQQFRAQTPDQVPDTVLEQAHAKATITARKMARLAASFRFLLAALALWSASIVCAALRL